ncbi:hypothetical protein [Thalassomonas sp. RHCl1]|uniref:hypothetical protein n=1 Tax=Thalassomonas sp. RHCl1 TaxID=2995320 RepID=UPI00248B22DE|nr:hypothetical protein [Thalassomonas sp. RHCl1]
MTIYNRMAFGTQFGPLQAIFDEKITDGEVEHTLWMNAWGRAIAYAWECDEHKKRLLENPTEVLYELAQYNLPDGIKLIVIEANKKQTITLERTEAKGESKVNYEQYRPKNIYREEKKVSNLSAYPITINNKSDVAKGIDFSLNEVGTETIPEYPINGWVKIPAEGLIVEDAEENYFWITTPENKQKREELIKDKLELPTVLSINQFLTANTLQGYQDTNPIPDQGQRLQHKDNGDIVFSPMDLDYQPPYFRLASTIIMTLPPKPDESEQDKLIGLREYAALGKIYPFTC